MKRLTPVLMTVAATLAAASAQAQQNSPVTGGASGTAADGYSYACTFEQTKADGSKLTRRGDVASNAGAQSLDIRGFGVYDAGVSFIGEEPRVVARICKRGDKCAYKDADAKAGPIAVDWTTPDSNGSKYRLSCAPNQMTRGARSCTFYGEQYGWTGIHFGGDGELNLQWVHGHYADVKVVGGSWTVSICKTPQSCVTNQQAGTESIVWATKPIELPDYGGAVDQADGRVKNKRVNLTVECEAAM
jgi:hypothetical protein